MLRVIGLVPQKETVSPGFIQLLVAFRGAFPDRESDGAVWPAFSHRRNNIRQSFIREPAVFSALKHKGAETKDIALLTAGKDILFCQAVALCVRIALSYTAVVAVIFTVICKFD